MRLIYLVEMTAPQDRVIDQISTWNWTKKASSRMDDRNFLRQWEGPYSRKYPHSRLSNKLGLALFPGRQTLLFVGLNISTTWRQPHISSLRSPRPEYCQVQLHSHPYVSVSVQWCFPHSPSWQKTFHPNEKNTLSLTHFDTDFRPINPFRLVCVFQFLPPKLASNSFIIFPWLHRVLLEPRL